VVVEGQLSEGQLVVVGQPSRLMMLAPGIEVEVLQRKTEVEG